MMMNPTFDTNEKTLSQAQAVHLLVSLGFEWISPDDALSERRGKLLNVLLEGILAERLGAMNSIRYKGANHDFSPEDVQDAIDKLKNVGFDGLIKSNEAVYDLIMQGTAIEQLIEGDRKSFAMSYIDWLNPSRNRYHVTVEYSVERRRSGETIRPDVVFFVNGIPLGVIECKAPSVELGEALSQMIRNQRIDYSPKFFVYSQLLLALNKNGAKYATTGTAAKFWSHWKEESLEAAGSDCSVLEKLVNAPMPAEAAQGLVASLRLEPDFAVEPRLVTEQDRAIYALCRPERLLELVWKFTLFDSGVKKVARYQQYFVVKSTLERVQCMKNDGSREGGIIWHTQGSGKSLTMVMLARSLALDPQLCQPRIVLVTDRDDLDKQLGNTFAACGLEVNRARSGRSLLELVARRESRIITTLVHKFEKAYTSGKFRDDSADIFVLVDEGHRTQFGNFAARMRQMFPRACYLGFTGTPLMKKKKNSFDCFGRLLAPHYSMLQAVEDGAVVPLLYEARDVLLSQNKEAIDLWFERYTDELTTEQKADLKRKYASANMLNKTEQVIYMRAFDISGHYCTTWQGTGFKAQLVAPDKATALRYHEAFREIGMVSSALVMSPPDMREGNEDVHQVPSDQVKLFWKSMMDQYGSESGYMKQLINQFKNGDELEILIVVDKLLTGFDAPRNAVLYLCRSLKEHTLLQAIARVNRLCAGKEFGYIVDYVSILGKLDEALTMYSALAGFDESDLKGTMMSVSEETHKLASAYSHLWDLFKSLTGVRDEEAYEVLLADVALREEFYVRYAEFARLLAIALSSSTFLDRTDEATQSRYKGDLRRFFLLKQAVQLRYAEKIDYRAYEPKIKKLLDRNIQANEVIQMNEPVNIFDNHSFDELKEQQGVSTASKADRIAGETKRVINERMNGDPAFYTRFSILIQQAIDDYHARRLTDLEYLKEVVDIRDRVRNRLHDDVPAQLEGNEAGMAYFGVIKPLLADLSLEDDAAADIALAVDRFLVRRKKVDFWTDADAQKQLINDIEDYLYDEFSVSFSCSLTRRQMDDIIEQVMTLAKNRS